MGVNIVQLLKTIQSPESGVSVGLISSMPLVKEKVGSVPAMILFVTIQAIST